MCGLGTTVRTMQSMTEALNASSIRGWLEMNGYRSQEKISQVGGNRVKTCTPEWGQHSETKQKYEENMLDSK